MSERPTMTEEQANAWLHEAFGETNRKRVMCGRCGEWSDWFPSDGIADSPPGWREPTGAFAWAKSSICPKCDDQDLRERLDWELANRSQS